MGFKLFGQDEDGNYLLLHGEPVDYRIREPKDEEVREFKFTQHIEKVELTSDARDRLWVGSTI